MNTGSLTVDSLFCIRDIRNAILSWLNPVQILHFSLVSKTFASYAKDERIWKDLVYYDFKVKEPISPEGDWLETYKILNDLQWNDNHPSLKESQPIFTLTKKKITMNESSRWEYITSKNPMTKGVHIIELDISNQSTGNGMMAIGICHADFDVKASSSWTGTKESWGIANNGHVDTYSMNPNYISFPFQYGSGSIFAIHFDVSKLISYFFIDGEIMCIIKMVDHSKEESLPKGICSNYQGGYLFVISLVSGAVTIRDKRQYDYHTMVKNMTEEMKQSYLITNLHSKKLFN